MSLIEDWNSRRKEISEKSIKQIVSYSGNGSLRDGNDTSLQLREFLNVVGSDQLAIYVKQCLSDKSYTESGLVFQDLVNEAGRRLGFQVEPGLYHGIQNRQNNYDGLWTSENGYSIVVESKSSTTYTIGLEKYEDYVHRLLNEGRVKRERTSILIVVGKGNTASLEQQIRGSRYAWNVRVISAEALLSLVKVRESLDVPDTEQKILEVLKPNEYTKVDGIVDLVFSVKEDIQSESEVDEDRESLLVANEERTSIIETGEAHEHKHNSPVQFYDECITKLEKAKKWNLIRKSRSAWYPQNADYYVVLLNSREYDGETKPNYWFALHDHQWKQYFSKEEGYLALGCGSVDQLLLLPKTFMERMLPKMGKTERLDKMWWHVVIRKENGRFYFDPNRPYEREDLSDFLIH